ncbi:MAG: hypothetical protein FJ298_09720 [Planctomycetes bacterium]|nr:hypothetical protein [Planctomycetota bacterium]
MLTDAQSASLLASAALIAVVHTAAGPDHTVPFVMLARARGWSRARTLWITALCGLGHVASSLILGALASALDGALGPSSFALADFESSRGDLAAWGLVLFGSVYALWGARQALRSRAGLALHSHDGHMHVHPHGAHEHEHAPSELRPKRRSATFWTLFTLFVLGPCEPLIPLYFLPLSQGEFALASCTALVFALATIATMLTLVSLAHTGLSTLRLAALDRWSHTLAGTAISATGLATLVCGL